MFTTTPPLPIRLASCRSLHERSSAFAFQVQSDPRRMETPEPQTPRVEVPVFSQLSAGSGRLVSAG